MSFEQASESSNIFPTSSGSKRSIFRISGIQGFIVNQANGGRGCDNLLAEARECGEIDVAGGGHGHGMKHQREATNMGIYPLVI
jgi:hypothetical protein